MKNRKLWLSFVICLLMIFALMGCSSGEKKEDSVSAEGGITVTDMSNKEVHLDAPAEKIVVLSASDCEILYTLGQQDRIIGRGEYCDYPEEVKDIDMVSSGNDLNAEQIIALQPDLLIMGNMAQSPEQIQTLEDAGITVAISDAQDIEGVYQAITMIGALTGADQEAASLCDQMKNSFDEIKEKSAKQEGGSIYFEVSPLEYGLWTAGSKTFMNEAAEMLNLKNAFGDVEGWAEISEEQVIERNPDYIMTITMYSGAGDKPEEEIMKRSGWESITAVKNKAIMNLPNNELSRPGPRLVEGTQMLYDFVYGDK